MTLRRAEKLCDSEILPVSPRTFSITLIDDGYAPTTFEFSGRTEKIALQNLVDGVYKIRSQRCFEKADWKCSFCGQVRPLQAHHEPYRSHGGRHVPSELKACCSDCHDAIHRGRKPLTMIDDHVPLVERNENSIDV